ncbi:MAG: DNA adenine methylase [Gemmatimonadales bacterium]|nr:DNA adenine methylase [Gemmatimonadales bacterium]
MTLKAPFPWFGGKRAVAAEVWRRFGDVKNSVEPFFGSGAVLLGRPQPFRGVETVNDADGLLCNFWRALQADPEGVARAADWPVNEADLHARHLWLLGQRERVTERLMGDPDYYDVKAAGWWAWGVCAWIGSGWCSGKGPWVAVDGVLTDSRHLGDAGQGINRQLPHLGDAGRGLECVRAHLLPLADRLRDVRVACGDWTRVVGGSVTWRHGLTAIFLDPPYTDGDIDYAAGGYGGSVAQAAREWAVANGDNPMLRIALCGYGGEHDMPEGWSAHRWKAAGGYGNQGKSNANRHRETIWFSPACLSGAEQAPLALEAAS